MRVPGLSRTVEGRSAAVARTSAIASTGDSPIVKTTNAPVGAFRKAGVLAAEFSHLAFLQKRVSWPEAEAVPAKSRAGDGGFSRPRATVCTAAGAFELAGLVGGTLKVPAPSGPPEHATTTPSDSAANLRAALGTIRQPILTPVTITRTLAAVAERFVPIVRDQRAALLGAISGITVDDWQRPTVCDPWTVKDVISHLVEVELLLGAVYRGELGDLAADNDAGVERWSKVDGDTVRYSLWHHGQATQRVIDQKPAESWGRRIVNSITGEELELREALPLHFFELAVHGHDVTTALAAPGAWGERAGALVEYCLTVLPGALNRNEMPPVGSIEIRVREAGVYSLDAGSEGWVVTSGAAEDPRATWETDAETLVLTMTWRIAHDDALERSKVEGDREMLEAVLPAFMVTR